MIALSWSVHSSAQISSINVNFSETTSPEDVELLITEVTITGELDSPDDFGALNLYMKTVEGIPVGTFAKTKDEMETDGELSGSSFTIDFSDIDVSDEYTVEFYVQRNDGANYAVITNNYSNE